MGFIAGRRWISSGAYRVFSRLLISHARAPRFRGFIGGRVPNVPSAPRERPFVFPRHSKQSNLHTAEKSQSDIALFLSRRPAARDRFFLAHILENERSGRARDGTSDRLVYSPIQSRRFRTGSSLNEAGAC